MKKEGLPSLFIETFAWYYRQLVEGVTGLIAELEIEPVTDLPDMEALPLRLCQIGEEALARTAVIKLNGGLGTSMGLEHAKSLLPVKNGYTFLDIIARQAILRRVPLILMNSFATRQDSLAALKAYPELCGNIPLDFLQHKAPKIAQADLSPISWPANPELEWCPPGHGDIYTALVTSGTLEKLVAAGYEYAFVSNSDNLGAVIDPLLLGYFVEQGFPFMMEVADRTEMDRKGGHLARLENGRLVLRESAQCPPEDKHHFQNIHRHRYFNTNNLWLHLPTLQQVMRERNYRLGLPMIRNSKTVDPRDPTSPPVYQLETAMGSAIAVFERAAAVRVPRTRFAPVKKTDDLLAVRSDAYVLTDDLHIEPSPEQQHQPVVITLDDRYYKFANDLDVRFPYGPPSLRHCTSLSIEGDFCFGQNVVCRGKVTLVNQTNEQVKIADGMVLEGEYQYG
ncbi:MAG: UTP--glucose-1-phosphate uridylyltransferase [Chloroflexi bacterium]|nr:MAG: UTP--glucose-1-phosphate uridylyltransferase [Chloroflexota bacterium]